MNGKTNMLLFNKADQNAYLNSAANFRGMVHNADDDIEILNVFRTLNMLFVFAEAPAGPRAPAGPPQIPRRARGRAPLEPRAPAGPH